MGLGRCSNKLLLFGSAHRNLPREKGHQARTGIGRYRTKNMTRMRRLVTLPRVVRSMTRGAEHSFVCVCEASSRLRWHGVTVCTSSRILYVRGRVISMGKTTGIQGNVRSEQTLTYYGVAQWHNGHQPVQIYHGLRECGME